MASTPVKVTVGESEYTIQRFRGLKAIMAMASLTRIAREIPDIMADSVRNYQKRNTIVITEPMARLPRWESFTKEDFDAAESKTGRREIELPTPMTQNEQIMYALPLLLENARKEVTRLLALLLIPNSELFAADKEDKVPEVLDSYEERLLGDAELDQLVDICIAASDVLQEQLADRKDRLGNLAKSLWKVMKANQPQSVMPSADSLPPNTNQELTQQTSTPDAPTSSIDSEEPTDGTDTQPSTASLIAS